ncbi:acetate kinase [Acetomicrobium thermoterrenum DSM 13490]|uniref:Acetate kinase n=1 Tax=Acetomicrobium thermoterrenum DSM 13490 TaxID=1120987 RepID=A0A1H3DL57_9BACT|nr:acetate kinase [Acetomicrobium thermoterrenum]SDX67097.1 acetate kinase [Acetomicrobium thermoterrenum DSM 13490]
MKILVLNCGSSSLKYQLFDMPQERVAAKGLVERIGIEGSRIKHTKTDSNTTVKDANIPNHKVALKYVVDLLLDGDAGVMKSLSELGAAGHRVVHGGEKFASSVVIDDDVIQAIDECVPLAPLHNPANLTGIKAMKELLPELPQVAVFDTAFHQTMPQKAYMYGLPYRYYTTYKGRRYGFHGTSHYYVAHRTAELMGKPIEELRIVTCHLGNGSSITAVNGGVSVDTSLGFGTVPGIIMGTRSGDVDPTLLLHIMEQEGMSPSEMSHVLHKESGFWGLSGISSDLRDIEEAMEKGNERATLVMEMLVYGIAKFVGAYAAAMKGLDAVAFTAGIGENSPIVREKVCEYLSFLGLKFDRAENEALIRGKEGYISTKDSPVKALVVPTNEELVIARDTFKLIDNR